MKHTAIASVVFAVSAALGTASFAQGRHDDKPHGMMKSAPAASEERGAPPVAGRHDERPSLFCFSWHDLRHWIGQSKNNRFLIHAFYHFHCHFYFT